MRIQLKGLIAVSLTSFLLLGCSTTHRASKEWEYKVVRLNPAQLDFEAQLNATANGEWKLLTTVPADGGANSGYSQYVFQRPKP
jgi:hypothetical protein